MSLQDLARGMGNAGTAAAGLYWVGLGGSIRAAEQVHRAAIRHDLDPADISAGLAESWIEDFDRALEAVVDQLLARRQST